MANTQNYINHLLQNTGITPACSEEERLAAEDIAQIFRNYGFDPEVQEFNAPAPSRLAFAVTGILAFAGALLMGIGGGIGLVGTLLAIVGAVLYVLERTGHPVVSRLGKMGVSQNVIAYHKASGPLASPRNRPVVVVAHNDSPRAELLAVSPMLRIVRLSPSCYLLPRLPLLPLPSCASCRFPARSRFCCGLSRSSLPSLHLPTRQTSSLTATFFPIRPARCATSLLSPLCLALWTMSPPSRARMSSPTMFRSTPILGAEASCRGNGACGGGVCRGPAAKRLRQHHRVRRTYLRRGRVRSADCSRRSDRARTG